MKPPLQPFDKNADFAQTSRRLPHRTQAGCTYFVTWRLADSVPREVLERWKEEREEFYRLHPQPWDTRTQLVYDEQFPRRMERWADAGHGACHLREPRLRQIMVDALHHFDTQRYDLDSYVVMPNHVHVLVTPRCESGHKSGAGLQPGFQDAGGKTPEPSSDDEQAEALHHTERPWSLSWIMQHWKGASSFQINRSLARRGTLWMDESFDHAVRSELQLERFHRYIRENPSKAGLKTGEFSLWETQSVAGFPSAARKQKEQP